ncbi:histidine kinase [Paenibacillus validus]|uniref:sensor histidine kinase n=1 Tax=Paenibacillus validus TaxID=44253 RepID=UPI000FDAFF29|nr:histidine kinase [Paenibacillus validus]MED4603512.1 histidine kinase [Paenibacillus validus]MED4605359.1 histidine kinase [Paenibacillus validus]
MPYKLNIFSKILLLIALLLIPILVLYGISNRTANRVVQEQIESTNVNQLSFFLHQLDSQISNLSMFPVIMGNDPYIREFIDMQGAPIMDVLKAQSRITAKLGLQSVSSGWYNDLTILLPANQQTVSSSIFLGGGDRLQWNRPILKQWTYVEDRPGDQATAMFVREVSEPARAGRIEEAGAVYQVRFTIRNITDMLDVYKLDKHSDPFLFHPAYQTIWNSGSNRSLSETIRTRLGEAPMNAVGQVRQEIDGQEYLVSYVQSEQIGWYLVDYVPVQQMLAPITQTSRLFYVSVGLLLVMSVLAVFLLYRNVQIPIVQMIRSMQRMKRGDLAARIEYRSKNEFDYLIQRFNEMAERIQLLVEDVYVEKIRSREASLKQLQSQINPHFLYNSLFFIINSAVMEDRDSVVRMAQNLADYCRYATRVENQSVKLRDELELVKHYLNIQNLRMQRLDYHIEVPEEMWDEAVPRLILQPLVENAIVHGIEHRVGGGRITITGEQDELRNYVVIEDNGAGLTDRQLQHLHAQLQKPMSEDIGCGTWNVHHRLFYKFGAGSGLTFQHGTGGGLRVTVTWNRQGALPETAPVSEGG